MYRRATPSSAWASGWRCAAIGSTDGVIASRSLRQAPHGGASARRLGASGGVVGLVMGEYIFGLAGGGIGPRVGWAMFGAFVCTSDGFARKMPARSATASSEGFWAA